MHLLAERLIKTFIIVTMMAITMPAWSLETGDTAPQIVGRDVNGSIFALSRLDNKPKVINLFWVECKPCKEELPLLAKKEMLFPNVIFASVHAELNPETETNYEIADIKAFISELKAFPSNMILGSERVKSQYGVEAFPVSFLLSEDNKVERVLTGFNQETIQALETWLKRQAN